MELKPGRDEAGQFTPSDKPIATIDNSKHGGSYYVLTMGEREMGGTNKAAMVAYARKLGYRVVAK